MRCGHWCEVVWPNALHRIIRCNALGCVLESGGRPLEFHNCAPVSPRFQSTTPRIGLNNFPNLVELAAGRRCRRGRRGIYGVSLSGHRGRSRGSTAEQNQGNYWPRISAVLCKTVKTAFILGAQKIIFPLHRVVPRTLNLG